MITYGIYMVIFVFLCALNKKKIKKIHSYQ